MPHGEESGRGSTTVTTPENLFFSNMLNIFRNICVIGIIENNDVTGEHMLSLPDDRAYDRIIKAKKEEEPLIVSLQRDSGKTGHAVVYVPHTNTIYDNHYPDNHTYNISKIVVRGKGQMVYATSTPLYFWGLIKRFVSPLFDLSYSDRYIREILTQQILEFPDIVLEPKTIQTTLQSMADGKGVCLYSAIIIYIELMKKKKERKPMSFEKGEFDLLIKTCNPKSIKEGFFNYILSPQVPNKYIISHMSGAMSVPKGIPFGGYRKRKKTQRKSNKHKKKIGKTKKNRESKRYRKGKSKRYKRNYSRKI